MSPGLRPRLERKPIRTQGLVRRVTPLASSALVVIFGLAALYVGLARAGGSMQVVEVVLILALALVAVIVHEVVRRAVGDAAAATREARELREREMLLSSTVGSADVGLGLVNLDTRWVQVNDALCAILGRTESELLGTTLAGVTAADNASALAGALDQLRLPGARRWEGESVQVRGDGKPFPVAISIVLVDAGEAHDPLFLVQETDLTTAKRSEAVRDTYVAVRQATATTASWEQAAPHVLGALSTMLGREVAQYWAFDNQRNDFKLRQSWQRDDPRLVEFDRVCHTLTLSGDAGLLGRARHSGVPAAGTAMSPKDEVVLDHATTRAGLLGEVACPVIATGEVRGVIVLFSTPALEVDDELMTLLSTVGSEIGQFMHRTESTLALQRSEADHRAIFEQAPLGIARISAEGELVEGNTALLLMLEHDLETLRNQSWPDLLRAYDLAAGKSNVAPLLAGLSDGGTVQVRAGTGSGRWLWLQMTATSIPDAKGRPEHILLMVEDVTKVRDAQDKLAEALDAQRNANTDLEKLDRTKTEFLSIVSHEFRTALTGIQGFSELIRDGGLEPDELRAYGGYIFNDADRVNRLIGDMLDLDRMESGRMSIRTADVDINEVLSDAIARAASANTVEFKPDLDPRLPIVTGDRDRLIQVVSNLVNNAVKYSPDGGTVTISSRAEGAFALVTVSDTGLGIPPDEIAHVFERFRRVRSGAAQSIAGTGLGLTIVKQIVEMHGGKIWVESAVGHGSAFHFTVPLAAEVAPAVQLRHA